METDRDQKLQEILEAHNQLRTDPKKFVPVLEAMVKRFKGNNLSRPGLPTLVTKEGAKVVK